MKKKEKIYFSTTVKKEKIYFSTTNKKYQDITNIEQRLT